MVFLKKIIEKVDFEKNQQTPKKHEKFPWGKELKQAMYIPVHSLVYVLNSLQLGDLTLYLIETLFNSFVNRADPDQAALVDLADQGLLCLYKYDISDPTVVDLDVVIS